MLYGDDGTIAEPVKTVEFRSLGQYLPPECSSDERVPWGARSERSVKRWGVAYHQRNTHFGRQHSQCRFGRSVLILPVYLSAIYASDGPCFSGEYCVERSGWWIVFFALPPQVTAEQSTFGI